MPSKPIIIKFPDGTKIECKSHNGVARAIREYLQACKIVVECPSTGRSFEPSCSWIKFKDLQLDLYQIRHPGDWKPLVFREAYNFLLDVFWNGGIETSTESVVHPNSYLTTVKLQRYGYLATNRLEWEPTEKAIKYLEEWQNAPGEKYSVPIQDFKTILLHIYGGEDQDKSRSLFDEKTKKRQEIFLRILTSRFIFNNLVDKFDSTHYELTAKGIVLFKKYAKKLSRIILEDPNVLPSVSLMRLFVQNIPKKNWAAILLSLPVNRAEEIKKLIIEESAYDQVSD